jgi:hypothetical protein
MLGFHKLIENNKQITTTDKGCVDWSLPGDVLAEISERLYYLEEILGYIEPIMNSEFPMDRRLERK